MYGMVETISFGLMGNLPLQNRLQGNLYAFSSFFPKVFCVINQINKCQYRRLV